jgi:hypothetical protein
MATSVRDAMARVLRKNTPPNALPNVDVAVA